MLGPFSSKQMPCSARLEQGRRARGGSGTLIIMGTDSINPDIKTWTWSSSSLRFQPLRLALATTVLWDEPVKLMFAKLLDRRPQTSDRGLGGTEKQQKPGTRESAGTTCIGSLQHRSSARVCGGHSRRVCGQSDAGQVAQLNH